MVFFENCNGKFFSNDFVLQPALTVSQACKSGYCLNGGSCSTSIISVYQEASQSQKSVLKQQCHCKYGYIGNRCEVDSKFHLHVHTYFKVVLNLCYINLCSSGVCFLEMDLVYYGTCMHNKLLRTTTSFLYIFMCNKNFS